jgi:hypothetical protein
MPSGIKLKQLASHLPGEAAAEYEIWHQKDRMILKETMKLHVREGQGAAIALEITGCNAPTAEEAMDKLAEWLERIAAALKERERTEVQIPIYS